MRFKKTAMAGLLLLGTIAGAGAASAATYTVKASDTMWTIAKQQGIPFYKLLQLNPQVPNKDIIWPGMKLNIPEKAASGSGTVSSAASYAEQVVSLVNQERAKAGLKPLASNKALSAMALDKAKDMYDNHYFDHTSPTYGSPFDMMTSYGISYSYAGENIAMGQRTPQEVMTAWMNSSGHRANILNPHYTQIGVGYYNHEWVQEFIAN
ncbi:hypothetical protein SD70_10135 [Gordoniibacillus kamchatkensis]|uniref:LysM domain-containing protein n=1 Tax=Gordoniibacillus kamchatkensis TaxID=1590651 RepID=A0ABR5AJF6_9BACL|nr:CAP domain-containing protein [Paenibacillus sp. VKM B-2647]KIL40973.1 hypothetical protein SD70_10135 [Paenibacillus sp. VKM B-2647]